jgi:hypothetical protein
MYNNVMMLHIIASWCGKKVTVRTGSEVQENSVSADVRSAIVKKHKTIPFNVTTFHINGSMITEVYLCISVFPFFLCFIYTFLSYTFTMSIVPESHIYVYIMLGFHDKLCFS